MNRTAMLGLRAAVATLLLAAPLLIVERLPAREMGAAEAATAIEVAAADPAPNDLPSLDSVLDRYVEAVGGRDALGALDTRVIHARMVTDLPTREPPVYEVDTLVICSEATGEYFIEQRTPRGVRLEGFDGEHAWLQDADGISVVDWRADRRAVWLRDPQNALHFRRHFEKLEFVGRETREWRPVYVVRIDDQPSHDLTFDVETGLLNGMGYHHLIEDYREVDGVLIPFRIVYGRKGGSSTLYVDCLEHNVPIDGSLFTLPGPPN